MPAVRQLCHSVHTVSSTMDRELLKLRKHVLVTVLCWTEMKHCSFQVLPRLPPLGAIAFIAIMRRCDSDPILHLRASLTSRVQSIGSWVRTTWVCFLDSFFFFFLDSFLTLSLLFISASLSFHARKIEIKTVFSTLVSL